MYVNSHVDIFDMVDIDLFTVVALNMMVVQLGYTGESDPLFYNYLRPLTSLDKGLYDFACKEDVCFLATIVRSFKFIEVYIGEGVTAVDSYIRPPRFRETIDDITDEPSSIAAIEHRYEKMLLLTWHDSSELTKEPVCESVTPRSLPQHDSSKPCKDLFMSPLHLGVSLMVIEDVIRQLSFEETQLDREVGIGDVELDIGRTQEPIVAVVRTQEPIMEEVRTQEPIVEC
nr:hypothetical protein [Tanacetum cinerariifolium]